MKNLANFIFFVSFNLFSLISFSQSDSINYNDVIKLNNGYSFKCKIIEVTEGGLLISTSTKKNFELEQSRIKLVRQHNNIVLPKNNITYFDHNRTIFGQINAGGSFGDRNEGLLNGRSFEAVLKARLSPANGGHYLRFNASRLGFEAAQSFSLWSTSLGYEFVFNRKKVSPFLYGNIGYGFNVKLNDDYDEVNNITRTVKTKANTNYEVGAGLLFRSSHGYAYTIGTTFMYQPASIDIIYSSEWGWRNQFELQLRRTFLKFGFIF